jgi:hypothetical protein
MQSRTAPPDFVVLCLGAVLGLCCCGNPCLAQLPQPALDQVFPLGAQAGSQLLLEIAGRELDEVKGLLFDHPGFKAELVEANKFRVTISAGTPPGMHEVRAVGRFGLSGAELFAVSRDLAEVRKGEPAPEAPDKAQVVALNSAINGRSAGNGADYYRFSAKKGQRVTIDCQAFRLDSPLRGVLTVSDPGGKELTRGTPYYDSVDPFVDFLVPADGHYILGIRDLTYAGDLPYRLILSDRPQVEQVFPPAVVPGVRTEVTIWGRNLRGGVPDLAFRIGGLPLDRLTVALTPSRAASPSDLIDLPASPALNLWGLQIRPPVLPDALNPLRLMCATDPVLRDGEPNDTPQTAQALKLPAMIVGRFDKPGDEDWYTFTAKAGETVAVDLACERLGFPGDPLVLLFDAKGMELAAFDDHGNNVNALTQFNRDPVGTFAIPADGTYRLVVRERHRKGGPRFVYALRVSSPRPDFYPVVYHETANDATCPTVRQGGAAFYEFCVNRRDGFDGPVTVKAEGLPRGVSCPPVHVSPQTETASIVFLASADAPDWAGPIRLKAQAMIGGQRVERRVGCVQRRFGNGSSNTATRVCREIGLAVRSQAPYSLKTAQAPLSVVAGGTLETKVTLHRLWADFKDKVQVTGLNLPPGFELEAAEIPEGKSEAPLKFTLTADVPPGTYTLNLRGEAQVPFQRDPAKPEKMNVRIADPATPLTVTVTAAPKK